ncbi:unnamed protein product [Dicrocoelium dendriticum]|nr:unnamed protein product [Dicrocoelium dendriticum]
MNLINERYIFYRMQQEPGESLNAFTTRHSRAVRPCDYYSIPQHKIEECMLTQQLVSGVADYRTREMLLQKESRTLAWDRTCALARMNEVTLQAEEFCVTKLIEVAKTQSIHPLPETKPS